MMPRTANVAACGLAVLALVATSLPVMADGTTRCRQEPKADFATDFVQGAGGGSVPSPGGGAAPVVTASADGTVRVTVTFECMHRYSLRVYKLAEVDGNYVPPIVTPLGAPQLKTGAEVGDLLCGDGSRTHAFRFGLAGGLYEIRLDWFGCNDQSGRVARRYAIIDPPVGLDSL